MKVIRKVQTQISPGISADCDPVLIGLVLQNLLSNALKYSGKTDHPVVEFGMLETGGVCQYYVRDNGAGFNTEHAQRLFQPFKRLHAASEFPGIGIGLATVNAIIERHQGKVWAESQPGVQTTFWFTLG